MDDATTGLSSTVLAFNEAFLSRAPDRAKALLRAVDKASAYVTANPMRQAHHEPGVPHPR